LTSSSFASTTGELDMDASQKQDLMSLIKEDGKGCVAGGDQMTGEGGV